MLLFVFLFYLCLLTLSSVTEVLNFPVVTFVHLFLYALWFLSLESHVLSYNYGNITPNILLFYNLKSISVTNASVICV